MERNKANLVTHLAGGLPVVPADRVQVQQVVINLIVNATEAMSGVSDRARTLILPPGPGIGVTLDHDKLRRYTRP